MANEIVMPEIDNDTALGLAQSGATAALKGVAGVAGGAGIQAIRNALSSGNTLAALDALAETVNMSRDEFSGMSATTTDFTNDLSASPITGAVKAGASVVKGMGTGMVGTAVDMAAGATLGVNTDTVTDAIVDGVAGTNTVAGQSVQALFKVYQEAPVDRGIKVATVTAGDVFDIVQSQLSTEDLRLIEQSRSQLAEPDSATLSFEFGSLEKLQEKARLLCGKAYDPKEPACEQIANFINDHHLPPAILLMDNDKLSEKLEKNPKWLEELSKKADARVTVSMEQELDEAGERSANPANNSHALPKGLKLTNADGIEGSPFDSTRLPPQPPKMPGRKFRNVI